MKMKFKNLISFITADKGVNISSSPNRQVKPPTPKKIWYNVLTIDYVANSEVKTIKQFYSGTKSLKFRPVKPWVLFYKWFFRRKSSKYFTIKSNTVDSNEKRTGKIITTIHRDQIINFYIVVTDKNPNIIGA